MRDAVQHKKGHIPGAVNIGDAGKILRNANAETFFNVGALNGRLSAMQARIEQLERESAAARTA